MIIRIIAVTHHVQQNLRKCKKQEKMFAGEERMLRDLAEVLLYQEIYRAGANREKGNKKFTVIVHCQENL